MFDDHATQDRVPEVRGAYNTAKSTAGEDPATRRARDLQRLDAQRDRCVVCGQLRGRGSQKRGPGLCQGCTNDKANSRVDMIIAMRGSMSDREIADTLEITYAAVRQKIYLARKAGVTVPPAFRPGRAVARS